MARARVVGTRAEFFCPGCDHTHAIKVGGVRSWDWNGSAEAPTFTPSVLVAREAIPDAPDEFAEWRSARVCHSFVTDGRIQFLPDSSHALAGQTVNLPEIGQDG